MARELEQALDWFEAHDIGAWNFCVLDRGMIGHERPRDRAEVLKSAGWGWVKNKGGHDVYMRPARGQSWPYIFLDDLGRALARQISKKYAALVVETSSQNFQVWVATTTALDEQARAAVQTQIAAKIGADMGSVSGEHFGRAPGYKNCKRRLSRYLSPDHLGRVAL